MHFYGEVWLVPDLPMRANFSFLEKIRKEHVNAHKRNNLQKHTTRTTTIEQTKTNKSYKSQRTQVSHNTPFSRPPPPHPLARQPASPGLHWPGTQSNWTGPWACISNPAMGFGDYQAIARPHLGSTNRLQFKYK